MTHWELAVYYASIEGGGFTLNVDPSLLWTRKDKKSGMSAWDQLNEMAAEGWELVSVTPIAASSSGTTYQLLYTFKRPKQ